MAKVSLVRRAQIGLERRAKSHAQLIRATRALISVRAVDSITVDDVTREAGVAKGTFYVHFRHLDDLRAAVADELAQRASRSSTASPTSRSLTQLSGSRRAAWRLLDRPSRIRPGEGWPREAYGRFQRLPAPPVNNSVRICGSQVHKDA